MGTLLGILVVLAALLFLLTLHGWFWRGRYRLTLSAGSTLYTTTEDGWRLAVHHYRGGRGEPVVLCHGLGANAFNMDLGERYSLARHLSTAGFDVWSAELRGNGLSRHRAYVKGRSQRFTFDDHVAYDVPAVIDLVLSETAHRRLHWVGHSMGGMVALAHLAKSRDRRVASVCTLGSPTDLEDLGWIRRLAPLLRVASFLPRLPGRWSSAIAIPFYRSLKLSYLTHHGRNVDTLPVRQALANLVESTNSGLLAQVSLWLRSGHLLTADGSADHCENLSDVTVPVCVIAGGGDPFAPPSAVRRAFEKLGSERKELHVLSKEEGALMDYGHGDLVIGRSAPDEVFPVVATWLEAQSPIVVPRPSLRRTSSDSLRRASQALPRPTKRPAGGRRALLGGRLPNGRLNPYYPYCRRRRERYEARRNRAMSQPEPAEAAAAREGVIGPGS
jgi:pimeloyl-ACP methyl ester carboxylesterase